MIQWKVKVLDGFSTGFLGSNDLLEIFTFELRVLSLIKGFEGIITKF